jgi:hypothetical protein
MKPKVKTPVVMVGQVGRNKFKAEIHFHPRVIVCSCEPLDALLSNNDTEERARIIAKRFLGRSAPMTSLFRLWLFIEVQTCLDEILVRKVTGLKGRGRGRCADYEELTTREAKVVEPFIHPLREQFEKEKESQKPEWARKLDALSKLRPQSVRTLPPSVVR